MSELDQQPQTDLAQTEPGRIATLDFMRGVAVLGILFANIVAFSQPMAAYFWPGALTRPMGGADEAVWLFQYLFIDGKMRGLFALLFGAGMVLFVDAKGARLQVRRLAWLAVFGLAHFFLLFRGDILFAYAMCGMLVLPMVRSPARTLLTLGLGLYLLGGLYQCLWDLPRLEQERRVLAACPETVECLITEDDRVYWADRDRLLQQARAETAVMRGGFTGIVTSNWHDHGSEPVEGALLALLETLPLMLVGMGLQRAGFFAGTIPLRALRNWGLAGIVAGAVLTLPLAQWVGGAGHPPVRSSYAFLGPAQIVRLPMILGMAACLVWLAGGLVSGWLGQRIVAAGRMAFSNYLGMSLLMAVLYQGWGLGRFGEQGRVELLQSVLAGWIVMLAWSQPWLARFRHGPLEWLWRCLAYGKMVPLRR